MQQNALMYYALNLGGSLAPNIANLQLFKERLGLIIEGEDEMACAVEGCNFLLNAGAPKTRAQVPCFASCLQCCRACMPARCV